MWLKIWFTAQLFSIFIVLLLLLLLFQLSYFYKSATVQLLLLLLFDVLCSALCSRFLCHSFNFINCR